MRFVFLLFAFLLFSLQPGLQGLDRGIVFGHAAPNGLIALQADLVLAFPLAFLIAAKMRQIGDPNNAVQWYAFVVNVAKNRHDSTFGHFHGAHFN
jgi:hypothetical protein